MISKITDAIVVTNSDIASDIKKYLSEIHKSKISVHFEVTKSNLGTAETLLKIKDKIKVRISTFSSHPSDRFYGN
jgi:NDP-sugar pyrophosphorylase family protein